VGAVPQFNQQQLANRARNSNRVTIMVGDEVLGFAQTTSHSFDFGTQQMYGIGSALPQEVQQLRVSPQITIDSFALTVHGLAVLGQPENLSSILANNQFNMHVVDGDDGNPLYTYVGAVASNFSENIPANQPISDSITFMAMDVLDKTGQSILNVGSALPIPGSGATPSADGLGLTA
jgi:hypothetical protein